MTTTNVQPLDIGIVREALLKLGLRKAVADKFIMLALEAGIDETEANMLKWCMQRYGGAIAH